MYPTVEMNVATTSEKVKTATSVILKTDLGKNGTAITLIEDNAKGNYLVKLFLENKSAVDMRVSELDAAMNTYNALIRTLLLNVH